jgi:DNA-binding NtrC family response regulator
MHNRYMILQQGLQQENSRLRTELEIAPSALPASSLQIDSIVRSIKRSTYQKAIDETVENLERACMRALLIEVAGDHRLAAELAGCELTDWLLKASHLQLA